MKGKMKNYWTDKKKPKFNQKFLDEARELERIWMKMGLIDLTGRFMRPTNGGHWLDGQRLTNETEDVGDICGAD